MDKSVAATIPESSFQNPIEHYVNCTKCDHGGIPLWYVPEKQAAMGSCFMCGNQVAIKLLPYEYSIGSEGITKKVKFVLESLKNVPDVVAQQGFEYHAILKYPAEEQRFGSQVVNLRIAHNRSFIAWANERNVSDLITNEEVDAVYDSLKKSTSTSLNKEFEVRVKYPTTNDRVDKVCKFTIRKYSFYPGAEGKEIMSTFTLEYDDIDRFGENKIVVTVYADSTFIALTYERSVNVTSKLYKEEVDAVIYQILQPGPSVDKEMVVTFRHSISK